MKSVPTLLLTLLLTACGTGAAPVTSSQPSKPAASPSSSAGPSSSIPSPSASASPAVSAATKPATSTSPSSPGSSAASANASPAAKPSPNGGAQSDDWPFYHKDLAHTGVGPASPALNQPKQEWSAKVDAAVYAEPLVQGGRVYVVTENDTAYALDAGTGSVVWQKHLGDPVPRSALPCGNIDPSGITATPALAGGTLYAVGRFQQPQIHHE